MAGTQASGEPGSGRRRLQGARAPFPWSTESQRQPACWSQSSTGLGAAAGARAEGRDT